MTQRAKYWSGLVAAWARSGLSQGEFCRRRGIPAGTFAWWKRRLEKADGRFPSSGHGRIQGERPKRRERSDAVRAGSVPARWGRPAKPPGRFVEVRLAGTSSASTYEVVLAGGRSIRVPAQFEPQILSRLITAVESC